MPAITTMSTSLDVGGGIGGGVIGGGGDGGGATVTVSFNVVD